MGGGEHIYNRLEIEGDLSPDFDKDDILDYLKGFDYKKNDFGFITGLGYKAKLNDKLIMPI